MTSRQTHPQTLLAASLEKTREQVVEKAPIFPNPGELRVGGLTNTEEATLAEPADDCRTRGLDQSNAAA